jgi:hypothetical protein
LLVCGPNQTNCSGTCVNLQDSEQHCSACGRACPMGQVCTAGACGAPCNPAQTRCNGACVNLNNDDANCGACDMACGGLLRRCVQGMCRGLL